MLGTIGDVLTGLVFLWAVLFILIQYGPLQGVMGRLSVFLHGLLWDDYEQSLCSRAYSKDSLFWRMWVATFGFNHCRESFMKYRGEDNG